MNGDIAIERGDQLEQRRLARLSGKPVVRRRPCRPPSSAWPCSSYKPGWRRPLPTDTTARPGIRSCALLSNSTPAATRAHKSSAIALPSMIVVSVIVQIVPLTPQTAFFSAAASNASTRAARASASPTIRTALTWLVLPRSIEISLYGTFSHLASLVTSAALAFALFGRSSNLGSYESYAADHLYRAESSRAAFGFNCTISVTPPGALSNGESAVCTTYRLVSRHDQWCDGSRTAPRRAKK